GFARAWTGYPSLRSRSITGDQLDESAHAPWTRTTVGFGCGVGGPPTAEAVRVGLMTPSTVRALARAAGIRRRRRMTIPPRGWCCGGRRSRRPSRGSCPGAAPSAVFCGAVLPAGRRSSARPAVALEQAEPDLADRGVGGDGVPEPVDGDLPDDRDGR